VGKSTGFGADTNVAQRREVETATAVHSPPRLSVSGNSKHPGGTARMTLVARRIARGGQILKGQTLR
jgi:hypothetical protein